MKTSDKIPYIHCGRDETSDKIPYIPCGRDESRPYTHAPRPEHSNSPPRQAPNRIRKWKNRKISTDKRTKTPLLPAKIARD